MNTFNNLTQLALLLPVILLAGCSELQEMVADPNASRQPVQLLF